MSQKKPTSKEPVPQKPKDSGGDQPQRDWTPASPAKRAMAWTGVVYMVILVALNTYYIYTGTPLTGLAPLLAVPGLAGLGVVALLWMRERGRSVALLLLSGVCFGLAVLLCFAGLPGLMANFGG